MAGLGKGKDRGEFERGSIFAGKSCSLGRGELGLINSLSSLNTRRVKGV